MASHSDADAFITGLTISHQLTFADSQPGRLKPHDLHALLAAINKQPKQRRVFFMTQLLHATREGETSLAEWKHFSPTQLEWYLPPENTKNGTKHRLPITQHVMDLINSLPKRGTCIFSVKFTSHDIRKLARDSWQGKKSRYRLGFLIMERGDMLLNHERDGLDKRYMHTHSREQMRKALGEWGANKNILNF